MDELRKQDDWNIRTNSSLPKNISTNKNLAFSPVKIEKDVDVDLPAAMEIIDLTLTRDETSLHLDPNPSFNSRTQEQA